jgi:hypothetical protein
MADGNIEGHFRLLIDLIGDGPYQEIWDGLNLTLETFESLGLARDVADSVLWQTCQREQLILITGNRNADGPDSLEETIRRLNTPNSLPVFTLANIERVFNSGEYAELVAEKLVERVLDIENLRGTGRIYLP